MPSDSTTVRGLGLAAVLPLDVVQQAAQATHRDGYHSFWLNNPPHGNALAMLGAVAAAIPSLHLGVGVIPLSHHPADEIAADVREHAIPLDRFYLGIGSGSGPGGVHRVREGLRAVRSRLEGQLVVAALGPRMCRLAGAEADAVLLNWLTPEWARRSVAWVQESAQHAGRPTPRLMAYVRVALGTDGAMKLEREAANYSAIPSYAAHFKRMGVRAAGTGITGDSPEALQEALAAWAGIVDELVIRAITANDTPDEILTLIEAVRPFA